MSGGPAVTGGGRATGAARKREGEGMMDNKGDTSAMVDWVKVEKTLSCQSLSSFIQILIVKTVQKRAPLHYQ